jgi:hypothetical protein
MKKNRKEESFMLWVREQVEQITTRIVDMLDADNGSGLVGAPPAVRRLVHHLALFGVLKVVHFPTGVLEGLIDFRECVAAYDAYAAQQSPLFRKFCESLEHWRPGVEAHESDGAQAESCSGKRQWPCRSGMLPSEVSDVVSAAKQAQQN